MREPLAVGALLFAALIGVYVAPVQVGALMDGLGLTAARSGFLGTMEIAAMSLTAIFTAPLLGRFSSARVVSGGLLLAAACECVSGFLGEFHALVIARCATGIGCGLVFGTTVAVVSTTETPDRLMGLGQSLANALFLVLFLALPDLLASYGFRGLFVGLGILVASTAFAARFLPSHSGQTPDSVAAGPRAAAAVVGSYCLGLVLLNLGLGALWGFVERIGLKVGLSSQQTGLALSACTVAMIGGSLAAGCLADRSGRRLPVLVATSICGIASYATAIAPSIPVYLAGLFLYGLAYLFLGPYLIVGVSSQLDPSGRLAAAAGGTMWLSYAAGLTAGGIISDTVSLQSIGVFAGLTSATAAVLFTRVMSTSAFGRRAKVPVVHTGARPIARRVGKS
jgi:MFS family permease